MKKMTLAIALAVASLAAHADTISGLKNTGAGFAAGSQDTNYTLTVTGGSTVLGSNHGYVAQNNAFPVGPWLANTATSSWLTPLQDQAASFDPVVNGQYTFHTTFNLAGFNASSASFSGQFAADNSAVAYLNGVQIGLANGFSSWSSFSANSGFVSGVNSLDFVVTNIHQASGNPIGLRVEFTASNVTAAVPEPETYGMLLAGLALVGFAAKRRRAA